MKLAKERKILIIAAVAVLAFVILTYSLESIFSFEEMKDYINSFGAWIPLVLMIIIIITSSIGFVFSIPVAIAALLLNTPMALLISLVGLTAGAAISFLIARGIGRDYVERKFINKIKTLKRYDMHLKHRGFLTILFLRLIMLVPYELINIAAGLSRISFPKFMLGTLVGIIPGTLLTIYFVRSTTNIWSVRFLLASIIMTVFAILPLFSRHVRDVVFNVEENSPKKGRKTQK